MPEWEVENEYYCQRDYRSPAVSPKVSPYKKCLIVPLPIGGKGICGDTPRLVKKLLPLGTLLCFALHAEADDYGSEQQGYKINAECKSKKYHCPKIVPPTFLLYDEQGC